MQTITIEQALSYVETHLNFKDFGAVIGAEYTEDQGMELGTLVRVTSNKGNWAHVWIEKGQVYGEW